MTQTDNKELVAELEIKIRERTRSMTHVYHTVAVHFADLHDTPERALEKDCINEIVPWRESRSCLYWRLRRLILENQLVKEIMRAQSNLLVEEGRAMLYRWFLEEKGATESHVWWQQNKEIIDWLLKQQDTDSTVQMNLNAVKKDAVISQIEDALKGCPKAALDSVIRICETLTASKCGEVVRKLSKLEFAKSVEAKLTI